MITRIITAPFRALWSMICWFAGSWRDNARRAFMIDQHKKAAQASRTQARHIKSSLKALRENRDPDAPGAPDLNKWAEVQAHWGITDEQRSSVIRGMIIEIAVWSAVSAYGVYCVAMGDTFFAMIGGAIVQLPALGIITVRTWRVWCIINREFVPFLRWIWPI